MLLGTELSRLLSTIRVLITSQLQDVSVSFKGQKNIIPQNLVVSRGWYLAGIS
jgi:hypothetical protein